MNKSNTWCSHLWNHQFIGPGGRVKPCCRFKSSYVPKDFIITKKRSSKDIFYSSFMNSIRKKMLNGEKIRGCERCYDEEKNNKSRSLRQIYNDDKFINQELNIYKPEIAYLELCFSNLCNLRCRMCNPNYSTNWNKDWNKLTGDNTCYSFDLDISKIDIESIASKIKHIKMTGGEPLLIKKYEYILEKLVKLGCASNIYLNYSTNLMVTPSKKLIKLWEKFKYIQIAFSLDGTYSIMEYIRFPTKWTKVEKNIKNFLNLSEYLNIEYGIRPTIMVYNILDLPNIANWWKEQIDSCPKSEYYAKSFFSPTHLAVPEELSITVFPKNIKKDIEKELKKHVNFDEKILNFFNHICNYMNSFDKSNLFPKFIEYTQKLDCIRKESFKNSCSKLYSILENNEVRI